MQTCHLWILKIIALIIGIAIIAKCCLSNRQLFLIYRNNVCFFFIKESGRSCLNVSGVFIFVSTILWLDFRIVLISCVIFVSSFINHFILFRLFSLLSAYIFIVWKYSIIALTGMVSVQWKTTSLESQFTKDSS